MNTIEHIQEPNHLYLIWMPPEPAVRRRYVVGEIVRSETGEIVLRYLTDTEEYKKATSKGFEGYPAYKIGRSRHSNSVLETFIRRTPPRSRKDFSKYLNNLRLPTDVKISDFALLGYSEAKLPGDGFSILNPHENAKPPFEFMAEIAGFRHQEGVTVADIQVGQSVTFEHEPSNPMDSNAVQVFSSGKRIGYINRIHAPRLLEWMSRFNVSGVIERVNGTPDRPLIYLFIRVYEK